MRRPLLNCEMKQHHPPNKTKTHKEESQLLGGQLPQVHRAHGEEVRLSVWSVCANQDELSLMVLRGAWSLVFCFLTAVHSF